MEPYTYIPYIYTNVQVIKVAITLYLIVSDPCMYYVDKTSRSFNPVGYSFPFYCTFDIQTIFS